jgi:hypothetical protein
LINCSGQRRGVADQRVLPAGFGDQHADRRHRARRARRLIARAVSVEPVKATPATRGSLVSAAPTVAPVARQELHDRFGHAGFMQQLHRVVADEVGLLGGLGDHAVAGGERRGDLAEEDREREIPRRDAHEHTAALQAQFVRFAGRARQFFRMPNSLRPWPA